MYGQKQQEEENHRGQQQLSRHPLMIIAGQVQLPP